MYRCKHCEKQPLYRDGLCWHKVSSLTSRSAFARCLCFIVQLGRELGLSGQTVLSISVNSKLRQADTARSCLPDAEVETDEMSKRR